MVIHFSNPSTLEAEAGGSGVQSQPGLHIETVSENQTTMTKTKRTTSPPQKKYKTKTKLTKSHPKAAARHEWGHLRDGLCCTSVLFIRIVGVTRPGKQTVYSCPLGR
jgi:hypothetical protein